MVNSKRYKDEFGNRIILEREDDDFIVRINYSKESLGESAGYDEWLITRKDFEKMKELDANCETSETGGKNGKD